VAVAGEDPTVGVLLLDLVLGVGVHDDPAPPLAAAVARATAAAARAGRRLAAVASVVGTRQDPQDLSRQVAQLESAGIVVLPSNAEAARLAGLALAAA
jgi:FdrA protein